MHIYVSSQKDRQCALPVINNGTIGRLVITERSHCLSFWLHIYYTHLTSVRFERSVYHESLLTSFICTYIYIYICVCVCVCVCSEDSIFVILHSAQCNIFFCFFVLFVYSKEECVTYFSIKKWMTVKFERFNINFEAEDKEANKI